MMAIETAGGGPLEQKEGKGPAAAAAKNGTKAALFGEAAPRGLFLPDKTDKEVAERTECAGPLEERNRSEAF